MVQKGRSKEPPMGEPSSTSSMKVLRRTSVVDGWKLPSGNVNFFLMKNNGKFMDLSTRNGDEKWLTMVNHGMIWDLPSGNLLHCY